MKTQVTGPCDITVGSESTVLFCQSREVSNRELQPKDMDMIMAALHRGLCTGFNGVKLYLLGAAIL